MKCFVTGASGFIGSNLVRELLARKHRVKALVRPGSDQRGLANADVELVSGDVSDPALLRREMGECEWCFHCAASYHLWLPDYKPMYAANVEGTFNVIDVGGTRRLPAHHPHQHRRLHRFAKGSQRRNRAVHRSGRHFRHKTSRTITRNPSGRPK